MPIRWVLVRGPDGKRPPQAFFSTDITLEPADLIALLVRRWQIEVTFAETLAHLGVETQRQWSDKAIARTTPALLGLYSLVSIWACDLLTSTTTQHAAAWYRKTGLTFSDAIGAVRLAIWIGDINQHSPPNRERQNIPPERILRMAQALCCSIRIAVSSQRQGTSMRQANRQDLRPHPTSSRVAPERRASDEKCLESRKFLQKDRVRDRLAEFRF